MNAVATQKGLCHTSAECREMYAAIASDVKAPVLNLLAEVLKPIAGDVQSAFYSDPHNWWRDAHMFWGLALRNLLRKRGFDAKYFGVHNLDDIYIPLVEEALHLHIN